MGKRKVRNELKFGILCPLLKKGNPMQFANNRGTKLPNIA